MTKLHLYKDTERDVVTGKSYPRYHWILFTMNGRELARSKPGGYAAFADLRRVVRLIFPWRTCPNRGGKR